MNTSNIFGVVENICILSNDYEDPRINNLRKISYGFILPSICCFGIIGNILNLIVLTRRNMQGPAYIYMRGYSVASLLAIFFCIPFTMRVLIHKETGGWTSWLQAFYHVHLELYLGNACLGVGVMMLSALTLERHASVCQPGQYRHTFRPTPRSTVSLLPLVTFLFYLPNVFKAEISSCTLQGYPVQSQVLQLYQKRDNLLLLHSHFYQVYMVILEVIFKIAPTILLAGLNLRIMLVYRRTCERRRRMRRSEYDAKSFAEERRLMLLLGSTSLLFLVCVSPMVFLNLTLSQNNLSLFPYQVFRATANLLEVINYSMTFYIYCLFSKDFRATLTRTIKCPWPRVRVPTVGAGAILGGTTTPTPSPLADSRPGPAALLPRRDVLDHTSTQ